MFNKKKTKILFTVNSGKNVTTYTIPKGVTSISNYAFSFTNYIKVVKIPASLKTFSSKGLAYVEKYQVDKKNRYFKTKDGILYDKKLQYLIAYPRNKKADVYNVPSSVISLTKKAKNYEYEFKLPLSSKEKNVKTLKVNTKLSYDNIPTFLDHYTIPKGNKYMTVKDGVIYSKNMKTIYLYPYNKKDTEYVMPDRVTTVKQNAFNAAVSSSSYHQYQNRYLRKITLSKKLVSIEGEEPLSYILNLNTVVIPKENTNYYNKYGDLYQKKDNKLIIMWTWSNHLKIITN
ncbi:cell surface protein [Lachnospiraceae bacterium KM106-2]|nr:cell surface protein [Lachnospiraceae bacterium KM106-2]